MNLKLSEKSKVFYHGSPYKLEYLKEDCDFTPYKEIAIAFGSKPQSLSVYDNNIYLTHRLPLYIYTKLMKLFILTMITTIGLVLHLKKDMN